MKKLFTENGLEDYTYWKNTDKKILKKIDRLIKETEREPFLGIGKPEPLKFDLAGLWSRRIDGEHRFIYEIIDDDILCIHACRFHY